MLMNRAGMDLVSSRSPETYKGLQFYFLNRKNLPPLNSMSSEGKSVKTQYFLKHKEFNPKMFYEIERKR